MPSATIVAKILLLLGVAVSGYAEGTGAYATAPAVWQNVCVNRNQNGWLPEGVVLDCAHDCLVSGIEPRDIGEYWLIYHDSLSFHL